MFVVGQRVKFSQLRLDECAQVAPGAVYMLFNWRGWLRLCMAQMVR